MFAHERACRTALLLGSLFAGGLFVRAQMVPVAETNAGTAQPPSSSGPVYNAALADLPAPGAPASTRTAAEAASSTPANLAEGSSASDAAEGVIQPPSARVRPVHGARSGDGYHMRPFRAVAFGVNASTLGGGAEMAMPLSRTLNVRIGGSYIRYDVPFSASGINYDPGVKFAAMRSTIDWFPHHGGFHVSAGALYLRNTIAGSASVAEGQTFTLGDQTYTNSVDDPIRGQAAIVYHRKTAPLVLLGFGNILPRSGRHLSVPIEFGGAYLETPEMNVDLAGTACTNQGCFNAATDPTLRANLTQEVDQYRSYLHYFQVYPVVSMGLACRF